MKFDWSSLCCGWFSFKTKHLNTCFCFRKQQSTFLLKSNRLIDQLILGADLSSFIIGKNQSSFACFFFFLVTKWHSNTAIPSHWPPNFFLLFLNLSLCWKVSQIHISSVLSNETPPIFSYQCVFKNNQPINRLSEFYSPKYHNQPKNVWFRSGPSFCQFSDRLRTEPGTES